MRPTGQEQPAEPAHLWRALPRRPWALPLLVALVACVAVLVTLNDYGVTWDEPVYCSSGISHGAWFRAPSWSRIEHYWAPVHDHPPFGTLAAGFLRYALHVRLGWVDEFTACRLQALIFVFILHFSLYWLVRGLYGDGVALLASLLFLVLPRAFFHAHLVALDYPITAMCVASACLFRSMGRRLGGTLAAACALALTLLTKINGFFLYGLLLAWFLAEHRHVWRGKPWRAWREWTKRERLFLKQAAILAFAPPVLFVLLWPWLWPSPLARVWEYLTGQAGHFVVMVHYMGRQWAHAPWHYPFVMLAVTTPVWILAPAAVGLGWAVRFIRQPRNRFTVALFLWPVLVMAFLAPVKYNGVRLFLPAFPFLCVFAALGLSCVYERVPRGRWRRGAAAALAVALSWGVVVSNMAWHPYQSSFYNALIGGLDGATARGFETTYWGQRLSGGSAVGGRASRGPLLGAHQPIQPEALLGPWRTRAAGAVCRAR